MSSKRMRWDLVRQRARANAERCRPVERTAVKCDQSFWKAWRDDTAGMKRSGYRVGVHHDAIAPALRELEALGIIRVDHGRGGNAEYRQARGRRPRRGMVEVHNLIASGRSLLLPVTTYRCPAGGRGPAMLSTCRFGLRISCLLADSRTGGWISAARAAFGALSG